MRNKKIIGIILVVALYFSMFFILFIRLFEIKGKWLVLEKSIIIFLIIIGFWAFISEYIEARKHKYNATKKLYYYYFLNSLKMLMTSMFLLSILIGGYYNINRSFFTVASIIGIIVSIIIIPIIQKFISKNKG
ncbi:MAG TPA: hypothetical protein DC034_08020 [Clostridium sp.]|jgi:hypothetical protein|nr:hypothetical protein [Clostridium sp.]